MRGILTHGGRAVCRFRVLRVLRVLNLARGVEGGINGAGMVDWLRNERSELVHGVMRSEALREWGGGIPANPASPTRRTGKVARDAGTRNVDPQKLKTVRRLRQETTMTSQWIAERLSMGTAGSLANLLRDHRGKR